MKTAIATRFCCSCPLTDLTQLTLMFLTLIFQYLNKLIESKVGDLTSPKPFHTVKVQSFNRNGIKPFTEFCCQLPMKVFALIRNLTVKACQCSDTTPPIIRTFDLARKSFVEFAKFIQGAFQRLWVLFLFTRAKRQIRSRHQVCPNALTCCWQTFHVRIVRDNIQPIVTTSVTLYRDAIDRTVPLAVFMKSVRHAIKSPFPIFPLAECKGHAIVFQTPARLSGKGDRFELMSLFDFRSATQFIEKTLIRCVNTLEFLLNRLAWQGVPMVRLSSVR